MGILVTIRGINPVGVFRSGRMVVSPNIWIGSRPLIRAMRPEAARSTNVQRK